MIRSELYDSWIARHKNVDEHEKSHPSGCLLQFSVSTWGPQVASVFLSVYKPDKNLAFERVWSDVEICDALKLREISIQQALAFGLNEVESFADLNYS